MVVETRYAAGAGVLLGTDERWLLLTDPDDEQVVERLWSALGDGPGAADRVLEIVEAAFGGEPPALVLVDLTPGADQTVSLGAGRVRVEGAARLISLGDVATQAPGPSRVPLRRLLGGVVAAQRAEIRPVLPRSVSPGADQGHDQTHGRTPDREPAPVTGLIDGIPQAILAARGPEGAPPPRPRPLRPVRIADTGEPDGDLDERGVGASPEITGSRADEPAEEHDDHDGSTVFRSGGAQHLTSSTGETVPAVWCPDGHVTPPDAALCRVCRKQVAPQAAQRVPRPTLGGLRLPTGEVVPLDRGVVLGRRPAPVSGAGDWPHLVHLPAEHTYVSRLHVQIELDGWRVLARDLGSRGGTTRKVPGLAPEMMVPHEPYVIEPGQSLDLAAVYEVRYEVGPEVTL